MQETNKISLYSTINKINIAYKIKHWFYTCWCGIKQPFVMNIYALRHWKEPHSSSSLE